MLDCFDGYKAILDLNLPCIDTSYVSEYVDKTILFILVLIWQFPRIIILQKQLVLVGAEWQNNFKLIF